MPSDAPADVPMTDPVCGMEVRPETAAAAWEHLGETYFFCSIGCWERFRSEPDRYVERPDRSAPS